MSTKHGHCDVHIETDDYTIHKLLMYMALTTHKSMMM